MSNQWSNVFHKRPAGIKRLHAAFLCWMVVVIHCPHILLAGHDLMVHLAIYNDGPFENAQVPAVFGVPLPSSDDPVDPNDLILVGADTWQIKPLSHWPNGSIRWMLVEAIVNVQPNQDRAAFHLTTGQAPEEQPLIASETEDGFVLDTGKCRIRFTNGDQVVCNLESLEGIARPEVTFQLTQADTSLGQLQTRNLLLENNGPATATISIVESYRKGENSVTFTRRCRVYKDHKGFTVDSTIHRHHDDGVTTIVDFPKVRIEPRDPNPLEPPVWNLDATYVYQAGDFEFEITDTKTVNLNASGGGYMMSPGSIEKKWQSFDFGHLSSHRHYLQPFLGRAISVNTYNDAQVTEAFIKAGKKDAQSKPWRRGELSSELAAQQFHQILGGRLQPTPALVKEIHRQMCKLRDWGVEEGSYDDAHRVPSLWYFLSGDASYKDLRLEWAEVQNNETNFLGLWDAYLLNSKLEFRDKIVQAFQSNWQEQESVIPDYRIRVMSHMIRQGGLPEVFLNSMEDRMEDLIHLTHKRHPFSPRLNGRLLKEAYLLTGEAAFITEGKQALQNSNYPMPAPEHFNGLLQNIQRQHIWRWLEPNVTDRGKEGWELSWKTPKNAVRYRFKQSDRKITNVPEITSSAETIAFYAAENLELNIAPTAPGTRQTVVVGKRKAADNTHFAMRYLERGTDLPALKSSTSNSTVTSSPAPSTPTSPKTYADFLMIGLLVVGLGLAFIAWRTFI